MLTEGYKKRGVEQSECEREAGGVVQSECEREAGGQCLEWWINTAEQRARVLRAWDLSGYEAVLRLGCGLEGSGFESR
jgi:hypothetical protein